MPDEQDPPIHPFYHLARDPNFQNFLAHLQEHYQDLATYGMMADHLDEQGHPELASLVRRHHAWKARTEREGYPTEQARVWTHPMTEVFDPTMQTHVGLYYVPWRVDGKGTHGMSFGVWHTKSPGPQITAYAPAKKQEILDAARRYGAPGADQEQEHRLKKFSHWQDPEQPDQLAATPTAPGGNSVVVRVPLPQPVGGKPAQPAAPAPQPAAPQQSAAPSARSFILPV